MVPGKYLVFEDIVLGGILKDRGMVSFADVLTEEDTSDLEQYVIAEAQALKASKL